MTYPPLMSGEVVTGAEDPFRTARMMAALGCDAGLVVYSLGASTLSATLVLAPEVPRRDAMAMLPACGVGFQNALGALVPPEVAVHLEWDDGLRVNGAKCGRFQVLASAGGPEVAPDWVAVGFGLPLWPATDNPGETPDETALYAEGCVEVDAPALLESWARHALSRVNRWTHGKGPVFA